MSDCLAIKSPEEFAAQGLSDGDPYGLSKACANSYTMLLARENPTLKINASTPGFIETDLTRPYAEARDKTPADMGMKAPDQGVRSTLFLLFGDPEGTGCYYGSDAVRSPIDRYRAPGDPPYTGE
jgi:NAD(P)-dependent dehydrogenase (short-subunit alcohol dehydrogenase family)